MTLLLRFEAPLQSWGYRSRFSDRDTGTEPTKSGVIGLLCCALGRSRENDPIDLADLKIHVRVDKEGKLLRDFHTAGGGSFRGSNFYYAPTSKGDKGKNPVITERHYLQDASFLVAVEGEASLIDSLGVAVQDPAWPLSLGRRSCPPSKPVYAGKFDGTASAAFDNDSKVHGGTKSSRFVWELEAGDFRGEARQDVPQQWRDRQNRKYGVRYVRSEPA